MCNFVFSACVLSTMNVICSYKRVNPDFLERRTLQGDINWKSIGYQVGIKIMLIKSSLP